MQTRKFQYKHGTSRSKRTAGNLTHEKCKKAAPKRRLTHSKLTIGGANDMSLDFVGGLIKITPA